MSSSEHYLLSKVSRRGSHLATRFYTKGKWVCVQDFFPLALAPSSFRPGNEAGKNQAGPLTSVPPPPSSGSTAGGSAVPLGGEGPGVWGVRWGRRGLTAHWPGHWWDFSVYSKSDGSWGAGLSREGSTSPLISGGFLWLPGNFRLL